MSTQAFLHKQFIAMLFILAPKWKQPKYSSVDEGINKCITCNEYYSAIKRNDILISAAMCSNLKNIMPGAGSQTQKNTCRILFMKSPEYQEDSEIDVSRVRVS